MKNYLARGIILGLVCFLMAASPSEKNKSLAPNFVIKDLDQVQVELSGFRNKKPVVLFFWTTWCTYCQKALRNFNRDLPELAKEGFEVLSINAGEPAAKVSRYAKNSGFTFRIFLDQDSRVSDAYSVYGVPAYFLIDKKGYLRAIENYFPLQEARELAKEE